MSRALIPLFALAIFASPQRSSTAPVSDHNATGQRAVAPRLKVGRRDWPQWGGSSLRNNTPAGKGIPIVWDIKKSVNIKWKANLGTFTFGTPIVANGRVFVATSRGAGYLKRFRSGRLAPVSALLCFDEQTGKFLWQDSSKRHPALGVLLQGWPEALISGNPLVDGRKFLCSLCFLLFNSLLV